MNATVNVMGRLSGNLKCAVTAILITVGYTIPAAAQETSLDPLFERLRNTDADGAMQIEGKIWREWSRSGSASMDLLLRRGREAMQAEDFDKAIEHFTALTDHAPDFAQGWNLRATAYYRKSLYGPAISDIQRTLSLEPRHFGALSGFALILEELGYLEEALEAYRAVEAIHPLRENLSTAIDRLEAAVGGQAL